MTVTISVMLKVAMDIGAPFLVTQQTKSNYPFINLDRASKYLSVYCGENKDDLLRMIKTYNHNNSSYGYEWKELRCGSETM